MTRTSTAWAPGRVNLIGEHLDYNGGRCLPTALSCGTTARVSALDDDVVRIASAQQPDGWVGTIDDVRRRAVPGWASYVAGVLWALDVRHGVDVHVDGDVPLGSGLSSSASLEAAVAVAVSGLGGVTVDDALRRDLVAACVRGETTYVGAPTGGLDQHAVLLGERGAALLLDFAGGAPRTVPFDPAADDLALLVVDTRASHSHVDGGYGSRRRECEEAAAALGLALLAEASLADVGRLDGVMARRTRHVVTEQARVGEVVDAAARRDWDTVGAAFRASHASLRDDFEVSCAELDVVAATAVEAGALGARMTGGGFGGSAVALVPSVRVEAVQHAVEAAFVRAGWAAPGFLDGTPGPGAHALG